MTKALLSTVATLALVVALGGIAQAKQTGHDVVGPKQHMDASTAFMYSSLCKAAIPVDNVNAVEGRRPSERVTMVPMTMRRADETPLTIVGAHSTDQSVSYSP